MKFKKILLGAIASALLVTAMPVFSASAEDTDPSGNNMLTAEEIAYNGIISSELQYNDNDWYKITVPSAGKVTFTISTSIESAHYYLYSANDESAPLYDKNGLGNNLIFTHYLTAGDYYIRLWGGTYGINYDMQVKFKSSDLSVENEDNNTLAKAAAVECDGTVYDRQLSLNDSIDYYTFDVAEQGRVTLNFDSPMAKTDWEIYDSEDALIKKGTFQKGEQDSGISAKEANIMKPGKYTIAFKSNEDYGTYAFSLDYLQNYNDIAVSGIIAAVDLNEDGEITPLDASLLLSFYAYLSTGGTETDFNKWYAAENSNS